ncbi:MAG: hypothetical protein RLZZ612_2027 [Pseudomonadota bacterium]|jgi:predicted Rossmann fold flavoprotein
MQSFDVIVVGAGAAGLFCAGVAGQRGLRVLLLDHSDRVAEKIRISGGGRCNFTNRDLDVRAPHRHFVGANPQFCRSALSRYTSQDFIALVKRHGIPFHEKHKGQLFCDRSAQDLIQMLLQECEAAGAAGGQVSRWQPCAVKNVLFSDTSPLFNGRRCYQVETDRGLVAAPSLVVATGGLSIPAIGATDFGYQLARQFKLSVQATRPGLVPLTFGDTQWQPMTTLAGLSLPVELSTGERRQKIEFEEDLLFTHRGLSGPGVLQMSSYWQAGQSIRVNLLPTSTGIDLPAVLRAAKQGSHKRAANELARYLPSRLADACCAGQLGGLPSATVDLLQQRSMTDLPDRVLDQLCQQLQNWALTPTGTEGYRKAEVTLGGVDTAELSQHSLEAKRQPGLYFIGEVVDISGWLGGYNFQWAWASAYACAHALVGS